MEVHTIERPVLRQQQNGVDVGKSGDSMYQDTVTKSVWKN